MSGKAAPPPAGARRRRTATEPIENRPVDETVRDWQALRFMRKKTQEQRRLVMPRRSGHVKKPSTLD